MPDKSGCHLNAGVIHHTPLMGLQRQMESLRGKEAIASAGCCWQWQYGCEWEECRAKQHNRSNTDLKKTAQGVLVYFGEANWIAVWGSGIVRHAETIQGFHANKKTFTLRRIWEGCRAVRKVFASFLTVFFCTCLHLSNGCRSSN